jgi:hypothetical protein
VTCKNWEFLEQDKAPILIFKVEPILYKLKKKSKTVGAHPSAARSEQRRCLCRPRSDRGRRCFATPTPPPPSTALRGYKRCTSDSSFPLFTFHHLHATQLCAAAQPTMKDLTGASSLRPLTGLAELSLSSGIVPPSSPTQPPAASTTGPCFHHRFTSARTAAAIESSIR